MTCGRALGGIVGGVVLSTLPFLHYAHLGGGAEAHADHEPRHGGQLGMVGDHHIELVTHRGELQVFVSDAQRRPLGQVRGSVSFDGAPPTMLTWRNHRLAVANRTAQSVTLDIILEDGTRLATTFDVTDSRGGRISRSAATKLSPRRRSVHLS